MAESAVTFLLNQLATLIEEERQLLGRHHEKVKDIERQLRLMQAFLRVADAKEDNDPELKEWVRQVRELAYDAEDVLDMFMLRFGHPRTGGFLTYFKNLYAKMKNYGARRDVALQLKKMESRAKNMYEKHLSYRSKYETTMNASSSHAGTHKFDGRGDARHVDENTLVGIEGPKERLIDQLLDGESHLKAISVVGMGGLGKSTLVNSIYKDQRVKGRFQCHAWVAVSQVYNIEELLRKLIRQLCVEVNQPLPQHVESLDGDELKMCIKDFLHERSYVLVLDDVWTLDSWDDIRHALPTGNTSSRVIMTTRILDVANATRVEYHGYVYKMKALSFKESVNLFCNKVFKDKICPPHLNHVAKRILAKCDGLPLAILAIGGLLASKDSISEWDMILKSFDDELDGKLERVKHVVLLSYYDLPYYLKSCLLYFSIFPEDYTVPPETIIQLWTAEGLVQGSENTTAEEVGERYLNELINRNLVSKHEEYFKATKKNAYNLHDIVLEVILSKSREQKFVNTQSGTNSSFSSDVRRLAISSSADITFETSHLKHLRSIFLFGTKDSVFEKLINDLLVGNHRLLKVLHLAGGPLKEIPNEVFRLSLLKNLSLWQTELKVVPKSIGKLLHLETLDLGETDVIELPIQILQLKKLRHLIVYKNIPRDNHLIGTMSIQTFKAPYRIGFLSSLQTFKAPYRIGFLSSLQTLAYIDADQMRDTSIVKEIGNLTQLKTLGISKLRREDGKDLCSSLNKLSHLQSLLVCSIEDDETLELDYPLSSIPRFLQELRFHGRLEKVPRWIPSLQELTRVELVSSKLRDDPLELLEDLPILNTLALIDNYEGVTLHFKAGKFRSLKYLGILHMRGLRSIVVQEDSMPSLVVLGIGYCEMMVELPIGLEHLTELHVFKVNNMKDEFVEAFENGKRSEEKLAQISMAVYDYGEREWKYL